MWIVGQPTTLWSKSQLKSNVRNIVYNEISLEQSSVSRKSGLSIQVQFACFAIVERNFHWWAYGLGKLDGLSRESYLRQVKLYVKVCEYCTCTFYHHPFWIIVAFISSLNSSMDINWNSHMCLSMPYPFAYIPSSLGNIQASALGALILLAKWHKILKFVNIHSCLELQTTSHEVIIPYSICPSYWHFI